MTDFVRFHAEAVDAFGRLRMSAPQSLWDSKLLHDKQPLMWDESITNTSGNAASTHVANDALVTMYVEAQDTIIRQSRWRLAYSPGKSMLVAMTGILTAGGTGVTGRIGAFDANNGLFFQVSGTTVSVVKRKATSDTAVAQADWNVDPFDGSGPSGHTLDFTKGQIFALDLEWLSLGQVRFGFWLYGRFHIAHIFDHTGDEALESAYISTPNLPLRYEIASAAGGDSVTMKAICSTVMQEGGVAGRGLTRSQPTPIAGIAAGTADLIYAVAGMRLSTGEIDASVIPFEASVMNEGAQDFRYLVFLNPTIAASSAWTYADVTNSPVQFASAGSTANQIVDSSTAWEMIFDSGYVKSGQQSGTLHIDAAGVRQLGAKIDGTRDTIVLGCQPLGNNATFHASLSWTEVV